MHNSPATLGPNGGQRRAGVWLHPTSFSGPYGCGKLGSEARKFIDCLSAAGVGLWQVLPMNPPGPGLSPYMAHSSRASNALLIDPEDLRDWGLLSTDELEAERSPNALRRLDPRDAKQRASRLLRRAHGNFCQHNAGGDELHKEFYSYCEGAADWLEDWALYVSLKQRARGRAWYSWERDLARREPAALERARNELVDELDYQRWLQFLFERQWRELRKYAREKSVLTFGDLPMFAALDSVEIWCRPDLFEVDENGKALRVVGAPPDPFHSGGQIWGHPAPRWDAMAAEGHRFELDRIQAALAQFDLLRLDHFIGYHHHWVVDASEADARNGHYTAGPGRALFDQLEREQGQNLPLVCEDLGDVAPEVVELRDELGLYGMRVLQFGFGPGPDTIHRPHNFNRRSVAYTGTHDNDTSLGWFNSLPQADQTETKPSPSQRDLSAYAGGPTREAHWCLTRMAFTSVANLAITSMQDLLGKSSRHRMNRPGTASGNWLWRLKPGELEGADWARLGQLVAISQRATSVSALATESAAAAETRPESVETDT